MVTILRHLIFSLIASLLHLMTKITDDGLQPCYALQAQEVLMLEASSRVEHFRKKNKKRFLYSISESFNGISKTTFNIYSL